MMGIKKFKLLILILIVSIIILPIKVKAETDPVYIGIEEIRPGETKNIYGGEVKLENEGYNYKLTLNNVNITDFYYDGEFYGIYSPEDLIIELIGNNTIISNPDTYQAGEVYYGIHSRGDINIIGNGILNIDIKDYDEIFGIYGKFVYIGDEETNDNPTINTKIESDFERSTINYILNAGNIFNSNLNVKLKGAVVYGLTSEKSKTEMIEDSDINMEIEAGYESIFLNFYNTELEFENVDMQLIGKSAEGYDNVYSIGLYADEELWIKDSRIIELFDSYYSVSFQSDSTYDGIIKFDHTDGKDFLFLSNAKMDHKPTIVYNNITNKMVYVGSTSINDLKQNDEYDINNLQSEQYYAIATPINNVISKGNNQNFKQNTITSFEFITNHFRYLVNNIKLDNVELNESDYELDKDGKVTLTTSGIQKLNTLDINNHKIQINYLFGNNIDINLNIVDSVIDNTTDNPDTFDNVLTSIIIGFVSIISLYCCEFYLKKHAK